MQSVERLHALDAVRAYALLLGVVLHSATVFLENFPVPTWRDEPSATAAVIYYVIHMAGDLEDGYFHAATAAPGRAHAGLTASFMLY